MSKRVWWVFGLVAIIAIGTIALARWYSTQVWVEQPVASAPVAQAPGISPPQAEEKAKVEAQAPTEAPVVKAEVAAPVKAEAPLPKTVAPPPEEYHWYAPVHGDTASGKFRDWQQVCRDNNLGAKCFLIVGQAVKYKPGNLKGAPGAVPVKTVASKPTPKKTPLQALGITPKAKEPGVFYWRNLGGSPLHNCGGRSVEQINEVAWTKMGLGEQDKQYLRREAKRYDYRATVFKPGDRLLNVTFCHKGEVVIRHNVEVAWKADPQDPNKGNARTWTLPSGRVVHWFWWCNNWGETPGEKPQPKPVLTPVPQKPELPYCELKAMPSTDPAKGAVRLVWTTSNTTRRYLGGVGNVPASGEAFVSPEITTTYILSVAGSGGETLECPVVVTVEPDEVPLTHVPEEKRRPCEVQAGTGIYGNRVYKGLWAYGEGICYIWRDGQWQAGPGVYGMYGQGESRVTAFGNKEYAYGFQVGAQRNWVNSRFKYATFDVKLRLLPWSKSWGSNSASGYSFTQRDKRLGLYAAYYERLNKQGDLVGVMAEAWHSFDAKMQSTWAQQPAQQKGSFGVSAFYETKISDDNKWRLRTIGGVHHTRWDKQNWFGLTAEVRYDDWLMFGPQLKVPLGISSLNEPLRVGDLTTLGAFVRVELGKEVKKAQADHLGSQLEYVPPPGQRLEYVPPQPPAENRRNRGIVETRVERVEHQFDSGGIDG